MGLVRAEAMYSPKQRQTPPSVLSRHLILLESVDYTLPLTHILFFKRFTSKLSRRVLVSYLDKNGGQECTVQPQISAIFVIIYGNTEAFKPT